MNGNLGCNHKDRGDATMTAKDPASIAATAIRKFTALVREEGVVADLFKELVLRPKSSSFAVPAEAEILVFAAYCMADATDDPQAFAAAFDDVLASSKASATVASYLRNARSPNNPNPGFTPPGMTQAQHVSNWHGGNYLFCSKLARATLSNSTTQADHGLVSIDLIPFSHQVREFAIQTINES
jgi:hypothetical protein